MKQKDLRVQMHEADSEVQPYQTTFLIAIDLSSVEHLNILIKNYIRDVLRDHILIFTTNPFLRNMSVNHTIPWVLSNHLYCWWARGHIDAGEAQYISKLG